MKIIGFILIVFSVAAIGFFISNMLSGKLRNMKTNEEILQILISGTEKNRRTFSELFDEIEKTCGREKAAEAKRIVDSDGIYTGTILDETDAILGRALCVFGTCFAEEQVRELEYYRDKIRADILAKEDSIKKSSELAKKLGVLAGFLFAVLLC